MEIMNREICFQNILRVDLAKPKPSANLEFNEKVNKLKESGRKVIHFGFGQSPFPVPNCLQDALKEFSYVSTYLQMSGLKSLRRQLVIYHGHWDGLNFDEENFIIAPGSKELLYLTLANFNGAVLLPTPAWPTYQPQCELAGKQVIKVDSDAQRNWKILPEDIEKACQGLKHLNKILIFTNPGNPSGQCYTKEEVIAISEICKKEGIIIASDEIYGRVIHSKEHYCMSKFYPEGTILYTGFSKWISIGGWRMGYVYFPSALKDLLNAVKCAASHTYTCAPAPMQYAVEKCLRESYDELEKYRKECNLILKTVGSFCYRELKSVGVGGCITEAGYYYIPDFEVIRDGLAKRGILTGKQMTTAMLEEIGVGLMPIGEFGRSDAELCVRFCFVCFDGNLTLKNINKLTGKNNLDDDFVKTFCPQVNEGIQNLKKWVIKHST